MRAILIFGMGIFVGLALAYLIDNGAAQKRFEAALPTTTGVWGMLMTRPNVNRYDRS